MLGLPGKEGVAEAAGGVFEGVVLGGARARTSPSPWTNGMSRMPASERTNSRSAAVSVFRSEHVVEVGGGDVDVEGSAKASEGDEQRRRVGAAGDSDDDMFAGTRMSLRRTKSRTRRSPLR